ncbi:MAG: hypothetical protein Q8M07_29920 [Prosthecobacter sp.]|nr:hypothetical protein [Prosthecobacter sp.]
MKRPTKDTNRTTAKQELPRSRRLIPKGEDLQRELEAGLAAAKKR